MIVEGMFDEMKVLWYVTYNCNYNCYYCINSSFRKQRLEKDPEDLKKLYNIGVKRVYEILKKFTETKKTYLHLTGGEPTLLDLKRIVTPEILQLNNIHYTLNTNGWRSIEWFEDFFKYKSKYTSSRFQISISLHETEINNLYETLEKFYKIMQISKQYNNCNVFVSFVATEKNIEERKILENFGNEHSDFEYTIMPDHAVSDKEQINKIGVEKCMSFRKHLKT